MALNENEILEYAYSRFEEGDYGEALEAFVLVYMKGFEQNRILDDIYHCYVDGNEMEFRKSYEKQGFKEKCKYEECILDFIPCQEGQYFIFDKQEKIFRGKFSIQELQETEQSPSFKGIEFSAAALEMDWDWRKWKHILAEAKNREIYTVCHDLRRAASFGKIPELAEYMDHVRMFSERSELQEYFHQNTSVYMPLLVFGDTEEVAELGNILNSEHQYRISPEGRNLDNVLLTIGIPTHDRGNLLLKRLENLRKMPYDAEIEIAISKNGTHYYQEEYKSVNSIQDARINYVGYDKELGMSQNWQNVIKMAHGKFVILVSDEDDVVLESLEHYLKFLSVHEECGIVSSKTMLQRANIIKDLYYKKGESAFSGGFMWDNYISGMIYNRKFFLEANIAYWDENYAENTFYKPYPHLWWQVLLAFKGDYARNSKLLILEGESMLSEEGEKYRRDNVKEAGLADGMTDDEYADLPVPSTYENRLKQFQGGIELVNEFFGENEKLKIEAWRTLLNKTLYLIDMVYEAFDYKPEEYPDWLGNTLSEAVLALGRLNINPQIQRNLSQSMLDYVKNKIKNI